MTARERVEIEQLANRLARPETVIRVDIDPTNGHRVLVLATDRKAGRS